LAGMATIVVATAASTTTAPSAAIHFGPGLIHGKCTASGVLAIQRVNGVFRLGVVRHFDETKTPRTPGGPVGDYTGAIDLAKRLEQGPQLCLTHAERKVADKDLLHF